MNYTQYEHLAYKEDGTMMMIIVRENENGSTQYFLGTGEEITGKVKDTGGEALLVSGLSDTMDSRPLYKQSNSKFYIAIAIIIAIILFIKYKK